jgi:anionic cell wall polymer biosynthesis LytR-Cps2A-Psr (LCP) family protein
MARSIRLRAGLLLALSLVTVAPVDALASAPDVPAPTPVSLVSDLIDSAAGALSSAGEALGQTADQLIAGMEPAAGPCSGTGGLKSGSDGRVTILLLGSDYREKPYIGERMDVIIVATRKANGQVAMASIPRDTAYFPLASGGTSGSSRVNTLYYRYKRSSVGARKVDCRALKRFTEDVEKALATEIDYYAMVRMVTFAQLVDNVTAVYTDIPGPIVDPSYGRRGAYFPDANDWRLVGNTACRNKKSDPCHSALAYVRSRHGTQAGGSNNDFKRALRQHTFIFDAAKRVLSRGSGSNLSSLINATESRVWTNVPKNMTAGLDIYNLLKNGMSLANKDRVVFGPSTYAYGLTNPQYAYKLRLKKVRAWINEHFGS